MNLSAANVLITGAAGGIGSEIARQLAARGASLLLADLRQEALEGLAAELAGKAPAVAVSACDISSEDSRAALVARARELGANVLVNAAGINPFGFVEWQPAAEISRTMLINAVAPMLLCQAMLPVLGARESAHIVNVGSTFGSIGFPGFCTYSASKFALRGFSEALRRELADTAIRVHYVAPRATNTALATSRVRAMNEELGVGMDSPRVVADAIVDALRLEKRETFLGAPERLFARINGLLPGLVDRSMRKQLAIVRRYAQARDNAPAGRPANLNPKEQTQ
jgi:short-subunit dehydrogenase